MKVLVICQGPAHGDERSYNGPRLAPNYRRRRRATPCTRSSVTPPPERRSPPVRANVTPE